MPDHRRLELRDLTRIPVGVFPEVQNPSGEIPIRQKAAYTVASLVIFLVGSNLPLYGVRPSLPPIHYTGCTRPVHHPTESLSNGVRIGRLAVEHDIHGISVKTGQRTVILDKIQSYYHQRDLRQNSVLLPLAFFHIETVCHACWDAATVKVYAHELQQANNYLCWGNISRECNTKNLNSTMYHAICVMFIHAPK